MSFIKPQRTCTLVSLAADVVKREGGAFVIVQVEYDHGSEETLAAFPSIDHANVELFDGPQAFRFDDQAEGQEAFTRLSLEMIAHEAAMPGSVDACVKYVGRMPYKDDHMAFTTSNSSSGASDLHVFANGTMVIEKRPVREMPR